MLSQLCTELTVLNSGFQLAKVQAELSEEWVSVSVCMQTHD